MPGYLPMNTHDKREGQGKKEKKLSGYFALQNGGLWMYTQDLKKKKNAEY